ncbi:hypothetical protein EH31_02195 [Erythrobacter longus]|uniref:DUF2809 domain-containing protein n=1 Tax=Erythrobacter longus TaxID=1044 RepID=A0A074MFC6_ERYLO|nr:DUF2809 domain-containing protein [Erythrobacter longus]KEO91500.1 hypothetical protein EH31_02195 [Erythrobacter longus]
MRLHRGYALAALSIFAVEVVIALFVRDAFIRPVFGDVLAAALVYCGLMAIFDTPKTAAAMVAFAFACLIEALQYLDALTFLGLEQNPIARVVLGTTFSWGDIIAYLVGAIAALLIDKRLSKP